ncbi:MAG: hypothetical protein AVDCRST_MAG18-4805, partial [uncultured Thermomicrobiales bacterium]
EARLGDLAEGMAGTAAGSADPDRHLRPGDHADPPAAARDVGGAPRPRQPPTGRQHPGRREPGAARPHRARVRPGDPGAATLGPLLPAAADHPERDRRLQRRRGEGWTHTGAAARHAPPHLAAAPRQDPRRAPPGGGGHLDPGRNLRAGRQEYRHLAARDRRDRQPRLGDHPDPLHAVTGASHDRPDGGDLGARERPAHRAASLRRAGAADRDRGRRSGERAAGAQPPGGAGDHRHPGAARRARPLGGDPPVRARGRADPLAL